MEIKEMTLADVTARMTELDSLVETSEKPEEIEGYTEELRSLTERKAELEALEERKANAKALEEGKAPESEIHVIEERKEFGTMKTVEEYRNSKEYIEAYAERIKTGDDTECRALLTTNTGSGTVVVPEVVIDEIKTAWDRNEILALVTNKLTVQGNIDQQFEISGDDAIIHNEGSGAVAEENLTIGNVKIVPDEIIKWITLSTAVMSMRGEAFLRYIYREISHKIMKATADRLINKIKALPAVANSTTPNAAKIKEGAAVGTVVDAIGNLSDEASNPVIIINKLSYAAIKKAAYDNKYGVDPFEGLDVRYSSQLPAFSAASENDVWMIVGDFGYGVLANYPNGDAIEITLDTLTLKTEGKVKAIGSEFVGAEPVACRAFTLVTKPATV